LSGNDKDLAVEAKAMMIFVNLKDGLALFLLQQIKQNQASALLFVILILAN
jgi:hypothetical protein